MTHVIVFGDSVCYGLFDEAGGWVQRIRARVDQRNILENDYWTLVYNLGVSGDTAADLARRIETELPARKDSDSAQKNIVVFAIGINDSAYLVKEGRLRFSEEEFCSNLRLISKIARKHADKIVFVGLYLVNQPAVDPIPWAPEMAYRNSCIRAFDGLIRNLCETEGFEYVNLLDLWNEAEAKRYLQDGAHPNPDGHKLITARVLEFFQKWALA